MKIPRWSLIIGPIALWTLGVICNVVAIASNKGQMPIYAPVVCTDDALKDDSIHKCMQKSDHVKWLDDWILIPGTGRISSIGDEFIDLADLTLWPGFFAFFVLYANDKGIFGA